MRLHPSLSEQAFVLPAMQHLSPNSQINTRHKLNCPELLSCRHSCQTVCQHPFRPSLYPEGWKKSEENELSVSFLFFFLERWRIAEGSVLSGVSECSCWPLKEFSLFLLPCCAAFIFNQHFGKELRVTREEILTENIFFSLFISVSLLHWV